MRKLLFALAAITVAAPAMAALKVGDKAPDFTTVGAVGGKDFKIHLAELEKKGPVVLYFFPKAFTSGCTAEAHAFSESIGDFNKAGAQVIGMSGDDLPTLHQFSAKECRSAFPVVRLHCADYKREHGQPVSRAGSLHREAHALWANL